MESVGKYFSCTATAMALSGVLRMCCDAQHTSARTLGAEVTVPLWSQGITLP